MNAWQAVSSLGFTPLDENETTAYLDEAEKRISETAQVRRTMSRVLEEYESKYSQVLASDPESMTDAIQTLLSLGQPEGKRVDLNEEIVVSYGQRLYKTRRSLALHVHRGVLDETLKRYQAPSYFEAGAGMGINLSHAGNWSGGDICDSARLLAKRFNRKVELFDFLCDRDYQQVIRPGSLVFTCHAIEQLHDSDEFIENLRGRKREIPLVINMEPLRWNASLPGCTMDPLVQVRNQYLRKHNYNEDLWSRLCRDRSIEVLEVQTDVIGLNPLNPSNIIVWRFR